MVWPPNPPLVRHGGRPRCEHDGSIKFIKLSKMAVEYICGKCKEPLGIIIDPDQRRINAYATMKDYNPSPADSTQVISGGTDVVMGKPRKLSYSERVKLK